MPLERSGDYRRSASANAAMARRLAVMTGRASAASWSSAVSRAPAISPVQPNSTHWLALSLRLDLRQFVIIALSSALSAKWTAHILRAQETGAVAAGRVRMTEAPHTAMDVCGASGL